MDTMKAMEYIKMLWKALRFENRSLETIGNWSAKTQTN